MSPTARIGDDVTIGPFTVVHDDVEIGRGTTIGSHCAIGVPTPLADGEQLRIGEGSTIRSHSVFYQGSEFGPRLRTGHQVSVREHIRAGEDLQLGTFADLQGEATIGRYVRIFNGAHITQHSTIGDFVWIFPYVVFTNDPVPPSDGPYVGVTVEDYAVVATRATVLPGITIGSDSVVGAQSLVSRDVEPGAFVAGSPAKRRAAARQLPRRGQPGPAYPWRRHFHRGYPDDVVEAWVTEFAEPDASS